MLVIDYLKRINYSGSKAVSLDTLIALHQAHVYTIPFENFDIQLQIPIVLITEKLFDKIVYHQRGGYCYELNGMFCWLLQQFGFNACLISGSIIKGKHFGPQYDHVAILVTIASQSWLVDVGYGDFSLKPLALDSSTPQHDGKNFYLIKSLNAKTFEVFKWKENENQYHPIYQLSTEPCRLSDFEPMNLWKQTSDGSHFTQMLICTIPTKNGRISLINQRLIITEGANKSERILSKLDISEVLAQYFNIKQLVNRRTN